MFKKESILLLFLLPFLFLLSIKKSTYKKTQTLDVSSSFFIILKEYQLPEDIFEIKKGMFNKTLDPEISYFDGFRRKDCGINNDSVQNDTITITPGRGNIVLLIRINAFTTFDYLIQLGDTIEISSSIDRIPSVIVRNRSSLAFDFSFDSLCHRNLGSPDMSALSKSQKSDLFVDYSKSPSEIKKQKSYLKATYSAVAKKEISLNQKTADSLMEKGLLSSEVYDYIKNKNKYISLGLDFPMNDSITNKIFSSINNEETVKNLGTNIYFYNFLEKLSDYLFTQKAEIINFQDGVNRNYCQVFDTILNTDSLNPIIKQYLLLREFTRIVSSFPVKTYISYFEKFKLISTDTSLIEALKNNYSLFDSNTTVKTDRVNLTSIEHKKLTLQDVLSAQKGKVIYIDLWASWCLPCRINMKYTYKLDQKYEDNKVVVLYLSIDNSFDNWANASKKEKIYTNQNSYIVTNFLTSTFFTKIKINSIPRYLIFDKSGNLIHSDAPSPESDFVYKIIDEQLKK